MALSIFQQRSGAGEVDTEARFDYCVWKFTHSLLEQETGTKATTLRWKERTGERKLLETKA
jgi:hypothetical protein